MFYPSHLSGLAARIRMSVRLQDSLLNLADAASTVNATCTTRLRQASTLIAAGSHVSPAAFALYFDIVPALEEDRLDDAGLITNTLVEELQRPVQPPLQLLAMTSDSLGPTRHKLVSSHFADPFFGESYLLPPQEELYLARAGQVQRALGRMQTEVPELYGEIGQTISEIIIAQGKPATSPDDYSFDGASSLEYWGAIALNTAIKKTDLQVFEMLAHESGHNTLFALSPDEFFVYNPDDERYASPLRDDPRPLDGIYHATFVLARMHYAISRLMQSSSVTAGEREEAHALLLQYRKHFEAGYSVLAEHADYTPAGERIMTETKAYMDKGLVNSW